MKKTFSLLSILCMLVIASGCSKDEAVLTGSISGLVSDYTNANQALAGATVTLNTTGLSKTTGSDGRYEFLDLEPGTYTLEAQVNTYQTTTKQVTVYAGQNATCDFQLEKSAVDVSIDPLNLTFGAGTEQLSFSIGNSSNASLSYSITNVPDFVQVSPTSGSVAAKGKQAVSVSVINRSSITTTRNGQLTVNVGNDSYTVNISVEPYRGEILSLDIAPQDLSFDRTTEQLSFTITSNNSRAVDYTIQSNLDILTVTPTTGTLPANGRNTITVTVNNRQSVAENRTGQLTITAEGNTFAVRVSVAKYEEGGTDDDGGTTPNVSITRGLQAYYTFDNGTAADAMDNYDGALVGGTFQTDTPNGEGKSLKLKKNEYVNIPYAPLSKKGTYSLSLWVKDFGTGTLFCSHDGSSSYGPTVVITDDGAARYTTSRSNNNNTGVHNEMGYLSSYQSGQWVMLTFVTTQTGSSSLALTDATSTFYINGQRVDNRNTYTNGTQSGWSTMTIGGCFYNSGKKDWADPFLVDNVRIYSVALTDDEVKAIYQAESR